MDHLSRLLTFWAVIALLCLWTTDVLASFPPTVTITGYRIGQDGPGNYASADAACTAEAASQGATGSLTATYPVPNSTQAFANCQLIREGSVFRNTGIYYNAPPPFCPSGSTLSNGQCTCTKPLIDNATKNGCVAPAIPPEPETKNSPQSCPADGFKVGKPIIPATGEEVLSHSDYAGQGPHALSLTRSFRSSRVVGALTGEATAGLGLTWSHNHSVSLQQSGTAGAADSSVRIQFGDGTVRAFNWVTTNSTWVPSNSADRLVSNSTGLLYQRLDDDSQWQFNTAGKLLTVTQRNGWVITYNYSTAATPTNIAPVPGLLIGVVNHFGRTLSFTYNAASQLISVASADQTFGYSYDSSAATGRLTTVTYPAKVSGGVPTTMTYLYENASFPQLITGILDENANRLASVAYDAQGRAISSGFAGNADLHTINYETAGSATVTDPLGTQRTYSYGTAKGKLAVTGADKPSGTGNSSASSRVQDANGFVTQETDFLGINTMYTWDINRRLPLTTTRAAGRPEVQTTTTQWHPTFRLPVLVTESGRSTTYSYDSAGNKLSETVTDTVTNQSRTTSWTYNAQGLPITVTAPSNAITQFSYDSQGNLSGITNAAGHVTTFNEYDQAGRVKRLTDPKGVVTDTVYTPRGWIASTAVTPPGGVARTTTFTYDNVGQLTGVALPDATILTYSYDAAHRLTGVTDSKGNSVTYTLDNMGNRVSEQVKDAQGNLQRRITRLYDALNRVQQVTGASN